MRARGRHAASEGARGLSAQSGMPGFSALGATLEQATAEHVQQTVGAVPAEDSADHELTLLQKKRRHNQVRIAIENDDLQLLASRALWGRVRAGQYLATCAMWATFVLALCGAVFSMYWTVTATGSDPQRLLH